MSSLLLILSSLLLLPSSLSFSLLPSLHQSIPFSLHQLRAANYEADVLLPPREKGLTARLSFPAFVEDAELVEIRVPIPFGIDLEPVKGLATITKENAACPGAEVGDVLRYTTQWTMGLPRGDGMLTTAASFSGGIGWQCSLLDVGRARSWEEVVEGLVSNTPQRCEEVVLIFERKRKGE